MQNNLKKSVAIILASIMAASVMAACGAKESENSVTSEISQESSKQVSSQESSKEVSENSTVKQSKYKNSLTGLPSDEDISKFRPVAVMINNIEYAQPLMSVSKADIIYECLVEGGITRLLAVYKNPESVGTIGSIRSARPPFIELARGFQAVYIHCGTSTQADALLKTGVITSFDLGTYSSWAWRDQQRVDEGYAVEHTLVTDGKTIAENAKANGVDMTVSYTYPQKFGNNSQVNKGSKAEKITVPFSSYKTTSFEYDKKEKAYIVSQFGQEMYDSTYDVHKTVENVLVLNVNSYLIDNEHVNLDLVGTGEGYYINGGKAIKIKWSKADSDSPLKYTTEDGSELIMKAGRQYVCCIPLSYQAEIS
ncbi:MAG: DUF3048 domain-containing protein [Clostridia bacterium]|nr:DUF3048 domain-containing protein [Clostridia bacterium]